MSERRPMSPVQGLTPSNLTPPPARRPRATPPPATSRQTGGGESHTPAPESGPESHLESDLDPELEAAAAAVNADIPKKQSRPSRPRLVTATKEASATATAADDIACNLAVSMPPDLDQTLRRVARERGQTQIDTVLDALSIGTGPLTELVKAAQDEARTSTVAHDGLFVRNQKSGGKGRALLSLRTRQANMTAIDNLVKQTGADNRSQMIVAALRRHLDTP